ncbi:hypothetical protein HHI36_015819 [Cryptolaemus montrouzieri]|uniref:Uncharacterized protein n=1 Tax=Cryptolaemus montrouzieri TaxID=559131 RepID=A0ABD2N6R4_9CUCU
MERRRSCDIPHQVLYSYATRYLRIVQTILCIICFCLAIYFWSSLTALTAVTVILFATSFGFFTITIIDVFAAMKNRQYTTPVWLGLSFLAAFMFFLSFGLMILQAALTHILIGIIFLITAVVFLLDAIYIMVEFFKLYFPKKIHPTTDETTDTPLDLQSSSQKPTEDAETKGLANEIDQEPISEVPVEMRTFSPRTAALPRKPSSSSQFPITSYGGTFPVAGRDAAPLPTPDNLTGLEPVRYTQIHVSRRVTKESSPEVQSSASEEAASQRFEQRGDLYLPLEEQIIQRREYIPVETGIRQPYGRYASGQSTRRQRSDVYNTRRETNVGRQYAPEGLYTQVRQSQIDESNYVEDTYGKFDEQFRAASEESCKPRKEQCRAECNLNPAGNQTSIPQRKTAESIHHEKVVPRCAQTEACQCCCRKISSEPREQVTPFVTHHYDQSPCICGYTHYQASTVIRGAVRQYPEDSLEEQQREIRDQLHQMRDSYRQHVCSCHDKPIKEKNCRNSFKDGIYSSDRGSQDSSVLDFSDYNIRTSSMGEENSNRSWKSAVLNCRSPVKTIHVETGEKWNSSKDPRSSTVIRSRVSEGIGVKNVLPEYERPSLSRDMRFEETFNEYTIEKPHVGDEIEKPYRYRKTMPLSQARGFAFRLDQRRLDSLDENSGPQQTSNSNLEDERFSNQWESRPTVWKLANLNIHPYRKRETVVSSKMDADYIRQYRQSMKPTGIPQDESIMDDKRNSTKSRESAAVDPGEPSRVERKESNKSKGSTSIRFEYSEDIKTIPDSSTPKKVSADSYLDDSGQISRGGIMDTRVEDTTINRKMSDIPEDSDVSRKSTKSSFENNAVILQSNRLPSDQRPSIPSHSIFDSDPNIRDERTTFVKQGEKWASETESFVPKLTSRPLEAKFRENQKTWEPQDERKRESSIPKMSQTPLEAERGFNFQKKCFPPYGLGEQAQIEKRATVQAWRDAVQPFPASESRPMQRLSSSRKNTLEHIEELVEEVPQRSRKANLPRMLHPIEEQRRREGSVVSEDEDRKSHIPFYGGIPQNRMMEKELPCNCNCICTNTKPEFCGNQQHHDTKKYPILPLNELPYHPKDDFKLPIRTSRSSSHDEKKLYPSLAREKNMLWEDTDSVKKTSFLQDESLPHRINMFPVGCNCMSGAGPLEERMYQHRRTTYPMRSPLRGNLMKKRSLECLPQCPSCPKRKAREARMSGVEMENDNPTFYQDNSSHIQRRPMKRTHPDT